MQVDHSLQSVHCKRNMYPVYVNLLPTISHFTGLYVYICTQVYLAIVCDEILCIRTKFILQSLKGVVEYSAQSSLQL